MLTQGDSHPVTLCLGLTEGEYRIDAQVRMSQPNGLKEGTCGVVYASKMITRRCNRNVCGGFLNE